MAVASMTHQELVNDFLAQKRKELGISETDAREAERTVKQELSQLLRQS